MLYAYLVRATPILEVLECDLGDDGTKLATSGGDAVRSRSVPSRKCLAGDDERGRVRTKVLKKIGETVQEHEGTLAFVEDGMIAEAL